MIENEPVFFFAILGILAALATPYFQDAREKARQKKCFRNQLQLTNASRKFIAAEHRLASTVADLLPLLDDSDMARCPNQGTYTWQPACDHPASEAQTVSCTYHSWASGTHAP